jgi:hypothetical protein
MALGAIGCGVVIPLSFYRGYLSGLTDDSPRPPFWLTLMQVAAVAMLVSGVIISTDLA